MNAQTSAAFPSLLQQFFVQRLMQQLNASSRTVTAYRDSFRLLLAFAETRLRKRPTELTFDDLNAPFILEFLDHLEKERHNGIRSRNARFAAIRSFMNFVALQEPSTLAMTQSVLAISMKRFERKQIGFLSREHIEAILAAPDHSTWAGQRDRVMLATLYNTGARVSEITGMSVGDFMLEPGPAVRIHGKGRKERSVPLWRRTVMKLKRWLMVYPRAPEAPLFPNRSGGPLTRVGVSERLKLAAGIASKQFPELAKRRISPHIIRHSTAMHLLQAGVNITVIAIWLGHESPTTTHQYVEADLKMKEHALKSLQPPKAAPARYRPKDQLLQFLQGL
jgi:site-specific recombinase XerD